MNVAAFYVAAVIAVITTLLVITRKNAVQALLYLAISLIAVAVIFYDLGAPFIAALEVIVYAGSIIVLFIFVVMMLNLGPRATQAEAQLLQPRMWIGPAILAVVLLGELIYLLTVGTTGASAAHFISPKEVGLALYGPYLIGVELSSMLLMAALVGAYHLGWHKQPRSEEPNVVGQHPSGAGIGGNSVRAGSGRTAGAA